MTTRLLFIASGLALLAGTTSAEQKTVYRCGQTYQHAPCAGGKAIDVADERSDAEREAGLDVARNEAELGARLRRERLEQERHQRVAGAANIGMRPKVEARTETRHESKAKKRKEKAVKSTLKPYQPPKANQATG